MRIISFILLIIVILIGVTFAVLNPGTVNIHYYLGEKTMPLSLLLVIDFVLGCLLGLLMGFWLLVKTKVKNYYLRQQLKLSEKEVENLRAIPLQDRH